LLLMKRLRGSNLGDQLRDDNVARAERARGSRRRRTRQLPPLPRSTAPAPLSPDRALDNLRGSIQCTTLRRSWPPKSGCCCVEALLAHLPPAAGCVIHGEQGRTSFFS
jgi:hypothetical protein